MKLVETAYNAVLYGRRRNRPPELPAPSPLIPETMEYYRIQLAKPGHEDDFNRFLKQIDGQAEPGGDIQLSGRIARGTIKKFHLDVGLYMQVWDLVFQEPVILTKEGLPAPHHNNGLSALYILTPENVVLKSVGSHQQFSRAWSRDVLLASDDVHIELLVQPHRAVQMIDFNITTYWFDQQLKAADSPTKKPAPPVQEWNFPVIRIEPCSSRDSLVTNKLFHIAMNEKNDSPPLQALSACMLTDLMLNLLQSDNRKSPMYKDVYYEKIMQV